MFTDNFFATLLQLEEDWIVKSVDTDIESNEIFIQIACLRDYLEDPDTGVLCEIIDHAQLDQWRYLDTMQYKTYLRCQLPRIITAEGKIKEYRPKWAHNTPGHNFSL